MYGVCRHLLSSAGVAVDGRDAAGATPLMHAAWGASLPALQVRELLSCR